MSQPIKPSQGKVRWISAICKFSLTGAAIVPVFIAGCSMCCDTHDYEYPMFHSNYARIDPEHGRVGSLFTDPNMGTGPRPLTNADVPNESRDQRNRLPDSNPPVDPNFEPDPFRGEDPSKDTPTEQDTAIRFQFPASRR